MCSGTGHASCHGAPGRPSAIAAKKGRSASAAVGQRAGSICPSALHAKRSPNPYPCRHVPFAATTRSVVADGKDDAAAGSLSCSVRRRISEYGYRRWPPSVRTHGRRLARAQRLSVAVETCSKAAACLPERKVGNSLEVVTRASLNRVFGAMRRYCANCHGCTVCAE